MKRNYETERLILRTLDTDNAQIVLEYFDRNRSFLEPWEPLRSEAFYTPDYQCEVLKVEQAEMEAGRMLKLWIFRKDDPQRVIGSLAFNQIVRGCFLSCILGYRLDEQEAGKGYMTEAVRMGAGVMFDEFGLHRIEANVIPRNAASRRVVEKAGLCVRGPRAPVPEDQRRLGRPCPHGPAKRQPAIKKPPVMAAVRLLTKPPSDEGGGNCRILIRQLTEGVISFKAIFSPPVTYRCITPHGWCYALVPILGTFRGGLIYHLSSS